MRLQNFSYAGGTWWRLQKARGASEQNRTPHRSTRALYLINLTSTRTVSNFHCAGRGGLEMAKLRNIAGETKGKHMNTGIATALHATDSAGSAALCGVAVGGVSLVDVFKFGWKRHRLHLDLRASWSRWVNLTTMSIVSIWVWPSFCDDFNNRTKNDRVSSFHLVIHLSRHPGRTCRCSLKPILRLPSRLRRYAIMHVRKLRATIDSISRVQSIRSKE